MSAAAPRKPSNSLWPPAPRLSPPPGATPPAAATIFTSSGGDGETIHDILNVLASPLRELSPTKFHNSVHNAAAGYWSIATGATSASTSLCAHDDSFAAGLLEAAAQAAAAGEAVALIAYDVPYPAPLFAVRPVGAVFGAALVLSPVPTPASFARLDLALQPGAAAASPAAIPALEELRPTTPAARCLPLLAALASGMAANVTLGYLDDMASAPRNLTAPEAAGRSNRHEPPRPERNSGDDSACRRHVPARRGAGLGRDLGALPVAAFRRAG